MHPAVYAAFDAICARRGAGGAVLEVGAVPSRDSLLLLPALRGAASRVGINREGPTSIAGFEIVRGDANDMRLFADASFDTVLCNATLEHDRRFWLTLAEIRRVARPGALVAIGVPGFAGRGEGARGGWLARRAARLVRGLAPAEWSVATPTLAWHGFPSDYYRFSPEAVSEVLCGGLVDVEVEQVLQPPRLIGSGLRACEGTLHKL